jgi:glutaredoxin 3
MRYYYKIYAWVECPFCIKAKQLLIERGEQFMFCCLDESPELLEHLKQKYDWLTVPLIIKVDTLTKEEEFIGGCSDLIKYMGE